MTAPRGSRQEPPRTVSVWLSTNQCLCLLTIQAISLLMAARKDPVADREDLKGKAPAGVSDGVGTAPLLKLKATLVICPVVAVIQWRAEIQRFTKAGSMKVSVHI
jgi:DNA repair protein RAD16